MPCNSCENPARCDDLCEVHRRGLEGMRAQPLDAETYNALTCAAFAIRCLQDGVDIGAKLPDTIARIEAMLARGVLMDHALPTTPVVDQKPASVNDKPCDDDWAPNPNDDQGEPAAGVGEVGRG